MAKKENIHIEETKNSKEAAKKDTGKRKEDNIYSNTEQINVKTTETAYKKEETNTFETIKYKTEQCKVLSFNPNTKEIDIDFKGYGVRLKNAEYAESGFVLVKYSGEIGNPDFTCRL